ncbi:hypothetical protein NDU88_002846 [Pleurodeles waltl]|uniref:Reverse transcriptase n=1 Tax=Pleurodeles waltl TaxID=8319 RepID=A0AAV7RGR0_PLEWA|nr:hypothetical protein NDU88_002846 [Pleurodeles waltl]
MKCNYRFPQTVQEVPSLAVALLQGSPTETPPQERFSKGAELGRVTSLGGLGDPLLVSNEGEIEEIEEKLKQTAALEEAKKKLEEIKGVSMGAACAPSVANVYVEDFERKFIYNEIAPFFENVSRWPRYIDDVFFIRKGEEELLEELFAWLNLGDSNLKFSMKRDKKQLEFLDVCILQRDDTL